MRTTITLILCSAGFASAQMIICPPDAAANVKLAAKEVRRYVYLRTGELPPILHDPPDRSDPTDQIRLAVDAALNPQQYRL